MEVLSILTSFSRKSKSKWKLENKKKRGRFLINLPWNRCNVNVETYLIIRQCVFKYILVPGKITNRRCLDYTKKPFFFFFLSPKIFNNNSVLTRRRLQRLLIILCFVVCNKYYYWTPELSRWIYYHRRARRIKTHRRDVYNTGIAVETFNCGHNNIIIIIILYCTRTVEHSIRSTLTDYRTPYGVTRMIIYRPTKTSWLTTNQISRFWNRVTGTRN